VNSLTVETTNAMPTNLESALDSLVDALQSAQRDRALPLVTSMCVDFPVVEQFVFMEPKKLVGYLTGIIGSMMFPKVRAKVLGHEQELIAVLTDVQKRLKEQP